MKAEIRNACKLSARKPEGKKPLGKPSCRQEDNIKLNLKNRVGKYIRLK
jgi:hypothetical protein